MHLCTLCTAVVCGHICHKYSCLQHITELEKAVVATLDPQGPLPNSSGLCSLHVLLDVQNSI